MQDYRRKIAYLYAYEGGEKLGNAGFVKAEDRGGIPGKCIFIFDTGSSWWVSIWER